MTDFAVRTVGITKRFGPVVAADGIDLELEPGMVLGLLGPNGAGKTTVVRILASLLRPDSGRAEVAGHDVVAQPHLVRRKIGLTGQFAAIDGFLTGRENIEMCGRLYHLRQADATRRASELLERFDLTAAADRRVDTYSGGMRRLVDLCCSLVADPLVLFLDEPTTGVDPAGRLDVWEAIGELRRQGTSVVLTTQYLEEADRLADRLAVVNDGRVIAFGTPDAVKATVSGVVIHIEVEDRTRTEEAARLVSKLAKTDITVSSQTGRISLSASSGESLIVQVARTLDRAGIRLAELALRKPTLDDVFLALTGRRAEQVTDRVESADTLGRRDTT